MSTTVTETKKKAPKPLARFRLSAHGDSDLLRACSLALALMRKAHVTGWVDYIRGCGQVNSDSHRVSTAWAGTAEELALLSGHSQVLRGLHLKPTVSVAVCTGCGAWMFTPTNGSKACPLSQECVGQLVKATPATAL